MTWLFKLQHEKVRHLEGTQILPPLWLLFCKEMSHMLKLLWLHLRFQTKAMPKHLSGHECMLTNFRASTKKCALCCVQPFLDHLAVVEKLGITSFDLRKIVDPFVKALPLLPKDLQDHILSVEEQITESFAWQADSSIYKYIDQADKWLQSLQHKHPSRELLSGCCVLSQHHCHSSFRSCQSWFGPASTG